MRKCEINVEQAKLDYYSDKVSSCGKDQKSLHKVAKHMLQGSSITILPSGKSSNELAQGYTKITHKKTLKQS